MQPSTPTGSMGPMRPISGVASCARSVTHLRMRSLTCSSAPWIWTTCDPYLSAGLSVASLGED
jgi:hypothetical protein